MIVLALTLLLATAAQAHDWHPARCCHGTDVGGDCAPIASKRVKVTPTGYLIDGYIFRSFKETQGSPDQRYHACFPTPGDLACFFAPARGM